MTNLPPDYNEFALAAEAAPDNMNGWVEEEKEEEEDPETKEEEDPEIKEEKDLEMEKEKEEEMEIDNEMYDPKPEVEAEAEDETTATTVGTITRAPYHVYLFSSTTYVGSGSSRQVFALDPMGKDVDTLHRKESMGYMMKNMFGLRWNCGELKGIVKLRFFRGYNHVYISSDSSPSSAIGFKKPIDMLGFFSWLASIKQGLLEPVKLALDREQHLACKLFGYREDSNEAAFAVAAVDKIYAHESLTFNNTVACEVISKWKAGLNDDMDARSDVYMLSNDCRKCSDDSDGYYWEYTSGTIIHLFLYIDDMVFSCGCKAEIWATKILLDKAKENVLGMEIVRDQSGNTLRVSQSRFYNGKLVQTLLEGHSILSLEGSLSGDCDVEKNGSLKANLQHIDALSTTEAGYMTFTKAWKKEIWLIGLLTESGYKLRLVACIATGALVKGGSRFEVPGTSRGCCVSVLTNSDTKVEIVRYSIHFSQ
nr:zinc finger, CCHC-type [Tanacetum cinerariifolium]